jgi:hypothetical protein
MYCCAASSMQEVFAVAVQSAAENDDCGRTPKYHLQVVSDDPPRAAPGGGIVHSLGREYCSSAGHECEQEHDAPRKPSLTRQGSDPGHRRVSIARLSNARAVFRPTGCWAVDRDRETTLCTACTLHMKAAMKAATVAA